MTIFLLLYEPEIHVFSQPGSTILFGNGSGGKGDTQSFKRQWSLYGVPGEWILVFWGGTLEELEVKPLMHFFPKTIDRGSGSDLISIFRGTQGLAVIFYPSFIRS